MVHCNRRGNLKLERILRLLFDDLEVTIRSPLLYLLARDVRGDLAYSMNRLNSLSYPMRTQMLWVKCCEPTFEHEGR